MKWSQQNHTGILTNNRTSNPKASNVGTRNFAHPAFNASHNKMPVPVLLASLIPEAATPKQGVKSGGKVK